LVVKFLYPNFMMIRFGLSLFSLAIVFLLTACSDRVDQSIQAAPSQEAPRANPEAVIPKATQTVTQFPGGLTVQADQQAAANPGHSASAPVSGGVVPKAAQTAQEIFAAFKSDLSACTGVVRYRTESPEKTEVNLYEPERILDATPYAGTPEVTYIKSHRDYVYVSLSYHPDPFTVSRLKETQPFYCAVTGQRMDDIEKLGASEEGWEIWAYFLNLAIDHLEPLMDTGPGGDAVLWRWTQQKFERAEELYTQTHREKLLALARRAASKIEASRAVGYETLAQLNRAETQTNSTVTPKSVIDEEFKARHEFIKGLVTRLQKRQQ
jgi:hypothetical protein